MHDRLEDLGWDVSIADRRFCRILSAIPEPMAYSYEVFLSYRRSPPVADWVQNHFCRLLEEWLGESVAAEPRIFIDTQVETGTDWPLELRRALLGSSLLVPIWSPRYFRSPWCMAELRTMQARENVLGLRTKTNPAGLIFPVRFNDGVPEDLSRIQYRDLQRFNFGSQSFAQTPVFLELVKEVQDLAQELGRALDSAPAWQDDWPVELPEVNPSFNVRIPRL